MCITRWNRAPSKVPPPRKRVNLRLSLSSKHHSNRLFHPLSFIAPSGFNPDIIFTVHGEGQIHWLAADLAVFDVILASHAYVDENCLCLSAVGTNQFVSRFHVEGCGHPETQAEAPEVSYSFPMTATACAAIASPRPIESSPS